VTTAQQKKTAASTNGAAAELTGLQLGLPSDRLQKLLASVTVAQPYPVTDTIVVAPPDKRRKDAMREAQTNLIIHSQSLERAYSRVGPIRPEYPPMPQPPEPVKAGAKKDAIEVYNSAVELYGTAVEHWQKLVAEWGIANTEWEAAVTRNQDALDDLNAKIKVDSETYTAELFGSAHEAVDDYFDGQPPELWDAFVQDIKQEFGIIAKPAQLPDDGTCPACGHAEDEEQALKAPTSSTGSKTTGTQ
jgi:hypothetical protein